MSISSAVKIATRAVYALDDHWTIKARFECRGKDAFKIHISLAGNGEVVFCFGANVIFGDYFAGLVCDMGKIIFGRYAFVIMDISRVVTGSHRRPINFGQ